MPDNENLEKDINELQNEAPVETNVDSEIVGGEVNSDLQNSVEQASVVDTEVTGDEQIVPDENVSESDEILNSEPTDYSFKNNSFDTSTSTDMPTVGASEEDLPIGEDETVTVQPVKFASFDEAQDAYGEGSKNLDNLLDIKLQLTVELGRATLPVRKVLELTRGSIVELEKVAGEPVELYANGKLIAHGEVVVIEDNFGLRITSMTDPEPKLNVLK